MRTLAALVKEYRREWMPFLRNVLRDYTRHSGLVDAVDYALAIHPHAAKHPHQYRLRLSVLRRVGAIVKTRLRALRGATSFDHVLEIFEKAAARVIGFGDLGAYDAALRVASHLGFKPKHVYLHAGTKRGCKALLGKAARATKLSPAMFPRAMQSLSAHEMEDFLCIYEDELKAMATPSTASRIAPPPRRSPGACP